MISPVASAGSPSNAFSPSGRTPEQQQSFATLENLLAIRLLHPALETGDEQVLHADNDVLIFARTLVTSEHAQQILVAVNKGHASQSITMSTDGTVLAGLQSANLLRGDCKSLSVTSHTITMQLAAETAAILEMH